MIITESSRCVPTIMGALGACFRREKYKGMTIKTAWKKASYYDCKYVIRAAFPRAHLTRKFTICDLAFWARWQTYDPQTDEHPNEVAKRELSKSYPLSKILKKLNTLPAIKSIRKRRRRK